LFRSIAGLRRKDREGGTIHAREEKSNRRRSKRPRSQRPLFLTKNSTKLYSPTYHMRGALRTLSFDGPKNIELDTFGSKLRGRRISGTSDAYSHPSQRHLVPSVTTTPPGGPKATGSSSNAAGVVPTRETKTGFAVGGGAPPPPDRYLVTSSSRVMFQNTNRPTPGTVSLCCFPHFRYSKGMKEYDCWSVITTLKGQRRRPILSGGSCFPDFLLVTPFTLESGVKALVAAAQTADGRVRKRQARKNAHRGPGARPCGGPSCRMQ
jgi:hypothetical protein